MLRVTERGRQGVDRLRIARRFDRPGRHLRFICDEEIVQMPRHESGTSWLLHDDVNNVLTVEVSTMAEELLFPVIMIFGAILKLPREATVRQARNLGLEGPAREGARRFTNIFLRIVADAHAEQLE